MKGRWLFHGVVTALALIFYTSCGKKPTPPPAAAPAPAPVTIESSGGSEAPPAPPPAPAPIVDTPGEAPGKESALEDPVAQLQQREMAEMNRGLKAFIAKHQRMPKDFAEFAQSVDGVPGPPMGKYWVIDAASQSIKLKSR